jgi:hypothetical protein
MIVTGMKTSFTPFTILRVSGKSFVEETMPVESVEEYFEHFRVLEIDYTFYSFLMDEDSKPTQNFHVLKRYRPVHEGNRPCSP